MTLIGRWSPNKIRKRVLEGTWAQEDDYAVGQGMALLTPTSITYAGTSATTKAKIIDGSGSVEFTDCTTLSLNGVFTSSYDNYMMTMRGDSSAETSWYFRLRLSGTDSSTGYVEQRIEANNTTIVARIDQIGGTYGWCLATYNTHESGGTMYMFGPQLAQPTAYRSTTGSDYLGAFLRDYAGTHSVSTSYDGITFIGQSSTPLTGLISVYGLVGA